MQEPEAPGMLVCSFSPDGAFIVAGAGDCHIYVWRWDVSPPSVPASANCSAGAQPTLGSTPGPSAAHDGAEQLASAAAAPAPERIVEGQAPAAEGLSRVVAGAGVSALLEQGLSRVAAGAEASALAAECAAPVPLCRLGGHRHDVLLLLFSHDGAGFATGSKDGTVRVRITLPVAVCGFRSPVHVQHGLAPKP